MAEKIEKAKTLSGLPPFDAPRKHYDIYAILEAPQELYFGDETQVNVNIIEKVRIWTSDGENEEKEKCYISPTKRRGVERRCLLHSDAGGEWLMDKKKGCGIPNTCCEPDCLVCRVFGGLIPGERTFIGRLTHGGGVAVAPQISAEKQRAMHPALMRNEHGDISKELLQKINKEQGRKKAGNQYTKPSDLAEPMPYRKEYAQPGLLYPIYNHAMSLTEDEFSTVAYAFLMSLPRLGAGNPKGVGLARATWDDQDQPLVVVDEYRVPMGERPIISPSIMENDIAVSTFIRLAGSINPNGSELFTRHTGYAALTRLQDATLQFEQTYLQQG